MKRLRRPALLAALMTVGALALAAAPGLAAAAGRSAAPAAEDGGGDAGDDKDQAKPAESTPEATLAKAFDAALRTDFEAYLATIHPFHKKDSEDREGIEKYSWRRFVDHASWYLDGGDPTSFEVVKQDEQDGGRRLFLKDQHHDDRMPVPVRFAKQDGVWYITANSL